MKTIAIVNQKGGVGKSTTAQALGQGLFLKGKKILYVDLDAQGNTSYTLKADTEKGNAERVLKDPSTIKEEIQPTEYGDILASNDNLSSADTFLTMTGKEYRLKEALELVKEEYDYCIIDTPPALGSLLTNALTCCDAVIIPAMADVYSLQGIGKINNTFRAIKKYCNPNFKVLGILLTRYMARNTLTRDVTEMLEETATKLNTKVFNTKIRLCIALSEAEIVKESIYTYAPKSNASIDYANFLEELEKENI